MGYAGIRVPACRPNSVANLKSFWYISLTCKVAESFYLSYGFLQDDLCPEHGAATSPVRGSHEPTEALHPRLPASVGSHMFGGNCASHTGIYLYLRRGDSYHPWCPRRYSWCNSVRYTRRRDTSGHRNYSLRSSSFVASCAGVDCSSVSSGTVKGPDSRSIGDNTLAERESTRRNAANWARRCYPQQWDASRAGLTEMIDALGLWARYDPPAGVRPTQRTKITDCGPVLAPRA